MSAGPERRAKNYFARTVFLRPAAVRFVFSALLVPIRLPGLPGKLIFPR